MKKIKKINIFVLFLSLVWVGALLNETKAVTFRVTGGCIWDPNYSNHEQKCTDYEITANVLPSKDIPLGSYVDSQVSVRMIDRSTGFIGSLIDVGEREWVVSAYIERGTIVDPSVPYNKEPTSPLFTPITGVGRKIFIPNNSSFLNYNPLFYIITMENTNQMPGGETWKVALPFTVHGDTETPPLVPPDRPLVPDDKPLIPRVVPPSVRVK